MIKRKKLGKVLAQYQGYTVRQVDNGVDVYKGKNVQNCKRHFKNTDEAIAYLEELHAGSNERLEYKRLKEYIPRLKDIGDRGVLSRSRHMGYEGNRKEMIAAMKIRVKELEADKQLELFKTV